MGKYQFESASSSVVLYVHRDHKDYQGRGAQDVHLDLHTAPQLLSLPVCLALCLLKKIVAGGQYLLCLPPHS